MTDPSQPPTSILSPQEQAYLSKFRQLSPEYQSIIRNTVAVMAENAETARAKEPEPPDPSEPQVHQCAAPALDYSAISHWDIFPDTFIPDTLTTVAVHLVTHAVEQLTYRLSEKVQAICEEYLPAEAKAEWSKYWGPLDDAQATLLRLTTEVAAMINRNTPVTVTTLEDMLHQTLKNSDFCCPEVVDDYVRKNAAPLIAFCQRQVPDFDPAWVTLTGAKVDATGPGL